MDHRLAAAHTRQARQTEFQPSTFSCRLRINQNKNNNNNNNHVLSEPQTVLFLIYDVSDNDLDPRCFPLTHRPNSRLPGSELCLTPHTLKCDYRVSENGVRNSNTCKSFATNCKFFSSKASFSPPPILRVWCQRVSAGRRGRK